MPIEDNIFLASYVRLGRTLSSGSISFIRANNSVKLLSDHPLSAFKLYNFNTADNLVNFEQPSYNGFSASLTNLSNILGQSARSSSSASAISSTRSQSYVSVQSSFEAYFLLHLDPAFPVLFSPCIVQHV